MATVEPYGKGYSVRYRFTDEEGRSRQGRKSGFLSEAEAWEAARQLERNAEAGIDNHGDMMTCGELMERWFMDHVVVSLADTTKEKYDDAITRLKESPFYAMPVRKVNLQQFNAYNKRMLEKMSARTLNTYTEPLRFSLNWGLENSLIPRNPLANAKLPKITAKQHVLLSEEDIDDLTASATKNKRNRAILVPFLLAVYGGLRREEAAALKWEQVDFKYRTISVIMAAPRTITGDRIEKDPKTKKSKRTIKMPQAVMDVLKKSTKDCDYVCSNGRGGPYALSSYSQALTRLTYKANMLRIENKKASIPKATFHDLRHTHAALLIKKGVQPKVIQERMGHSSIKITMDTYGYLMTGIHDHVADVLNEGLEIDFE